MFFDRKKCHELSDCHKKSLFKRFFKINCSGLVALVGGHVPHQVVDKLFHFLDVLKLKINFFKKTSI